MADGVEQVRAAVARRLTVSTVKHAHHAFDIDHPGKDSYRHREAGCSEVLITSGTRWALMHELRGQPELSLEGALARRETTGAAVAVALLVLIAATVGPAAGTPPVPLWYLV